MKKYRLKPRSFDLEKTLTCGQTFCWHRFEGQLYNEGKPRFYTFKQGEPIVTGQKGDEIEVKTTLDRETVLETLGIDHDLEEVFSNFPEDEKMSLAREEFSGIRIIQDDFFPCLVSYIMSSQMQIPVIKRRFNQIAEKYGETVEFDGEQLMKFPSREQLSEATEEDFRDIGVGYRSEYIAESIQILKDMSEKELRSMEYAGAKKELKKLHGVGNKVADCVLLFSLGFHEATPLDTWAKKAVKHHYPKIHSGKYEETSRNLREHFGPKAGYATEYLFHAARQGVIEVKD